MKMMALAVKMPAQRRKAIRHRAKVCLKEKRKRRKLMLRNLSRIGKTLVYFGFG
jgi:hypothetical protein